MDIQDIHIDPEIQSLLRPLSDDEFRHLREDILETAEIRDAIIVWSGPDGPVLLDGHNRLRVYRENQWMLEPPTIVEYTFDERHEALNWVLRNQLARRNLTPAEISYYRGKLYNEAKKNTAGNLIPNAAGEARKSSTGQFVPSSETPEKQGSGNHETAERIATEHGVNERTIRRDGEFAEAVDQLEETSPGTRAEVLSGRSGLSRQDVQQAAEAPPEERAAEVSRRREGRKAPRTAGADSPDLLDGLKRPVPEHLRKAFANITTYRGLKKRTGELITEVKELFEHPGTEFLNLDECLRSLKQFQTELRFAEPHTECPACQGTPRQGCKLCDGIGYITRETYGRLSDEEKQWLSN